MKTMKYLLLAAVIAGGLLALNTQAGPKGEKPSDKQNAKRAEAKSRVEKMAEELGLSAEQKEKIKPILAEEREKLRGMKDLTPEQRQTKAKEARKEIAEKLKPILTPEQFEKWQNMRKQQGGKKGGKPGAKAAEKK